ncbi:MAG: peroxiredoxin [Paracoccaceae bacterium]|nr:peroxiredoxin [Paracoccaceae bacterium]
MTISVGDKIPLTAFVKLVGAIATPISGADIFQGRKVAIFGLPGAYTSTCDSAHVPSFIRVADALRAKGVDEIICLATNDPWVMGAWSKSTGVADAGITFLSDPESKFTTAIGMEMSAPAVGFHARSKRYAMYADNGVVKIFNPEVERGVCEISAGETLLAQI